jgi:hypothetical protein
MNFAFTRGYFWVIRPIIRKPHITCAVILVNPCFIHVHDIIPCFPKRFDLSQIITPVIDNRHLTVRSEGLIDGCDLVFLAKSKDGDYHQEMNSVVFLEWFENPLMPALKNPGLVVHSEATYNMCSDFGNRHLIVQNSSIITYFFISISKINES